jgi:NADH-quinone oxidoreductase subunit E
LCDGTACHVRESIPILEALYKRLKIDASHNTTPDMLFTVETVSCLGACGLAPAVVVNDEVHGLMTPEKAVALIDAILAQEAA